MIKKLLSSLIVLAFVSSCFLLMVSCATQQAGSKTGGGEESAASQAEAERQAKLRELEKQQVVIEFNSEAIYFAFDKSDLTAESKAILDKKADWLRKNYEFGVTIMGHCDERGTNEYNLALGERRAHAAKNYLMALGIAPSRIDTISYGEEKPADPGHNPEAWAKNRRDEFKAEVR